MIPGSGRFPEGGTGNALQYSCLEKSHRQRSAEDYSPKCHKESDTTEQLSMHASTTKGHHMYAQTDPSVLQNSRYHGQWGTEPFPQMERKKAKVLVIQSWLTLWDPMGCSPPGFFVYGNLQARILDWVAIPFSRGSF